MNIWVVGESYTEMELLGHLLSMSHPSSTVISCTSEDSFSKYRLTRNDIVISLNSHLVGFAHSMVEQSLHADIPVLVVANDINEVTYNKLIKMGIKGILNSNLASLDSIISAIRVLKDGGFYIESPMGMNKTILQTPRNKPVLDIDEWRVFSLTSKGWTVDEIAERLGITERATLQYQKKIMKKADSKTLPGAVAIGINQGWLLDSN